MKLITPGLAAAAAVAAAGASLATPAEAHHSGAMFDRTKETAVTGVIKEIQWTNPHAWIEVVSADQNMQWGVEFAGGPQTLLRIGMTRSNPKVGDKVTIVVHPLKDGRPGGSFMRMTLADGRTLGGDRAGVAGVGEVQPGVRAP